MTWVYLVIMIIILIIGVTMQPKPPEPKPNALEDFEFPTAEEGRPVPVVFGTYIVKSPNIVWYGDLDFEVVKGTKRGK